MKVTEWREELKAAEAAIEAARDGLAAAKEEVRGRQKRLDRAQQRRAEILRAFISGESQLPLFEEGVEDDDEPASFVPVAADPSGVPTAAEADALEEELERQAAERSPFAPPIVNPVGRPAVLGDPAKFAAALADAEDYSAMWSRPWLHETTLTIAGEAVAVEIGYKPEHRVGSLRFGPPLSSAGYGEYGVGKLVDGLPTDLPERWRSRPYEFAERLARHLARLTAAPGRVPDDAPDAPAWRATPLADLAAIGEVEREQLARCGVRTAGDLADAIDLGVDDARTDFETEAVLIPDGPWRAVVEAVEAIRAPRSDANANSTKAPRPGESEFDRELRASLHNTEGWDARWAAAVATGLTDAELTERIGQAYGTEGASSGPGREGHRYAGGSKPRFWFGARYDNGRGPDLQGAALRDKVRELLGIPKSPKAADAKAVDDWARTWLNMVVIRKDLLDWLAGMDLHTLGDLADACELCGSLKEALDDWTPEAAAEVERDVRTWTAKRPGFPLEILAPARHPAPTRAEIMSALATAVDSSDVEAWRSAASADGGYDPNAIRERLARMWPSQPTYFEPVGDVPGFTVRGDDRPAFWLGHARPSAAAMCRAATLMGYDLYAAVAEVLEDAAKAAKPAKPAKRKAKRPAPAEARP